MYRKIQTPNSPLSPLPPCGRPADYLMERTPNSQYLLTPSYSVKISHQQSKRRSFTPCAFDDDISPPGVSPINIETVMESPDADFLNDANISKISMSSAKKLFELVTNTPENATIMVDRKSRSCSVNQNGPLKRAYHCHRKNENRPNVNINITSLRRKLYSSFQSPSMTERVASKNSSRHSMYEYSALQPPKTSSTKCKNFNQLFDSPTQFNAMKVTPPKTDLDSTVLVMKSAMDGNNRDPKMSHNQSYSSQLDKNINDSIGSRMVNNSLLNRTLTVESILMDIGLQKYIEKFQFEEIDLYVFLLLEPADLYTLNIEESDHSILLQAIKWYASI